MRAEDVPLAERLSAEAFLELDVRQRRADLPPPVIRSERHASGWVRRTHHLLETDPGGCWVVEGDEGLVGMATSLVREVTWCLATYAVRPGHQGRGIGRALLEAALAHGRGCTRAMLSSSADPLAARRYRLAGFSLHPQMFLTGTVDRTAIPVDTGEKVREGAEADRELMDSLDRRTRGSAHGPDHAHLLAEHRLLVSDTTTGSGYAYVDGGSVLLLAADNRRTAARLLWAALADSSGVVTQPHLTDANQWALDVGLGARLALHTEGYLALRGMKPPAPYVHHGALQ